MLVIYLIHARLIPLGAEDSCLTLAQIEKPASGVIGGIPFSLWTLNICFYI